VAPVKSMRLVSVDAVELDTACVRGDRRFYLVDDAGYMTGATLNANGGVLMR
jgi:uncharacterized protein YcbX